MLKNHFTSQKKGYNIRCLFFNYSFMSKKWVCSLPMVRRMFTSVILWILFGFLCAYLAWAWDATQMANPNYWGSAMMWNIVFNRFLIGVMIAFAGFVTFHPILKVRMYPALRGAFIWAGVSLGIAFGPFIMEMPNAWTLLWYTLIAGAVYGMIIDLLATKVGWEGSALMEGTQK